jgi:hypothetical protein
MRNGMQKNNHVSLFWTGGWDSTFRLLKLLIDYRIRVIPFYLIDAERPSTGAELLTMKRIKDRLFNEYTHTKNLLHPTQFFTVADLLPDSEITEAFLSIRKEKFMGSQYEWLARYCKQCNLYGMELCIHRDDKAHFVIQHLVRKKNTDPNSFYLLDKKYQNNKEYKIFKYFIFPVFDLSKIQMASIIQEKGWSEIMNMTWFCYRPRPGMKPCGVCNPCIYTIEEGLGWRISFISRVKSFVYRNMINPMKISVKKIVYKLGLDTYIKKVFKY